VKLTFLLNISTMSLPVDPLSKGLLVRFLKSYEDGLPVAFCPREFVCEEYLE
jgi:hypothetical protein